MPRFFAGLTIPARSPTGESSGWANRGGCAEAGSAGTKLYSRNRLNVAVSRAKCLAVLVASPALLTIKCRTAEQMRLVNALCRFVEMADARGRLVRSAAQL